MKKVFLLFLFVFSLPTFATGINGASAPCDNATLSKYTGTADIEINWEPNTINLNWYDGDTKLTVQQSAQSCVYDGTLTVPTTQPTKPGYTFNGWKVIHVPGGYTELEYIQNASTGYIDTGVYQNTSLNNIESYIGFAYTATPSDRQLMGFNGEKDNYWGIRPDGNKVVFDIQPSPPGTYGILVNTKYDIYTKQIKQSYTLKAYLNNTLVEDFIATGYRGFNDSQLRIFNLGDGMHGTTRYQAKNFRIYYYRVYMDGNLVFNGIPARRNSDGVIGIYDSVSNTFKTNSSSGTFIAGPAVQ